VIVAAQEQDSTDHGSIEIRSIEMMTDCAVLFWPMIGAG
jgi:hypothetical protein